MSMHKKQFYLLAGIVLLIVGAQCLNVLMNGTLNRFGIWPRHLDGLYGIVLSPWLHTSWAHVWANLPPLILLSLLVMWDSTRRFINLSVFVIVFSGLIVWCVGRNGVHVGASSWIFGLWAWLIVRSLFERSIKNILIAIFLVFLYGGLVYGLLPKSGVSFEGHLAGAVCGVVYAAWGQGKGRRIRR